MFLRKIVSILVFILLGSLFYSQTANQPTINAIINSGKYKVGDQIEVLISISDNPGLHSLFFDLHFDSSILSFDNIQQGGFFNNIFGNNELLYALSDEKTSTEKGSHLIVSYTLKGANSITKNTGTLLKLKFTVKNGGIAEQSYKFNFSDCEIIDGVGQKISTIWQDSNSFSLYTTINAFISIKKPIDNTVIYDKDATVDLICTSGNYKVKILNNNTNFSSSLIDVTTGFLSNKVISLAEGNNKIIAELYDKDGINKLAINSILVFKESNKGKIKIINPQDHSLLNTDTVDVTVISSLENITVNGLATQLVTATNGERAFKTSLILKNGFNTITAKSVTNGIVYQDSIIVYYQKDKSIFSIVSPTEGENFKSSANTKLVIKGEIDSIRNYDNPSDSGSIDNTVTLRVHYRPKSGIGERDLVYSQAKIQESDYSKGLERSKYMFINDFDIILNNLENGIIDIYAYKNKQDNKWDDMVKRTVYIDDNRLWIDLVEPNIFTSDTLDTLEKLNTFNGKDLTEDSKINISKDTGFILAENNNQIEKVLYYDNTTDYFDAKNIVDMVETSNGDKFLLRNSSDLKMRIYKKGVKDTTWRLATSIEKKHGYKMCALNNYVIIGTSNLETSPESDLFILDNNKLYNIKLPEVIKNIQFVINKNDNIYLYGSNFLYLYKFSVNSLIKSANGFTVEAIEKELFDNSYTIMQFELVNNGKLAIMRLDTNEICFYKKTSTGYVRFYPNNSTMTGRNLVSSEYTIGDYNAFITVDPNSSKDIKVIMQNKNNEQFTINSLKIDSTTDLFKTPDISLASIGFKDNNFIFILKKDNTSEYIVKKGQVFFKNFYPSSTKIYNSTIDLTNLDNNIFSDVGGNLYTGFGNNKNLYFLFTKYVTEGEREFNYMNPDIDGIVGIGFEIDKNYRASDAIELGFYIKDLSTDAILDTLSIERQGMSKFGDTSNDYYTLTSYYDGNINKQVINIAFKKLLTNKYLKFKMLLKSNGDSSPAIYNLKVYKKIQAKVARIPNTTLIIPIHGYIYDKTVSEIYIEGIKVPVARDGSFYYDYNVNTTQKKLDIDLQCKNSIGEEALLNFTINLVDSLNELLNLQYKISGLPDSYKDFDGSPISTNKEKLLIKGQYWGLSGCTIGYELYSTDNSTDPIKRALFTENITTDYSILNGKGLGTGYEGGIFVDQTIDLIPGPQKLLIYCENPGGLRYKYQIGGDYPKIIYDMDVSDQRIEFDGLADNDELNKTINGIKINKKIDMILYESQIKPYYFAGRYQIFGEVKSIYNITDLKIKSFTNGLTFDNGETELIIPVDASKRFNFIVDVRIANSDTTGDFYVGVIPTLSFLSDIKTGVKISSQKSLVNTNFIPDFSEMSPDKWTQDEKDKLKIPVKVKFERTDIPKNLKMNLTLNYEAQFDGILDRSADNLYYLKKDGNTVKLQDKIKNGVNRLQWAVYTNTNEKISSSTSGREGMSDYLFEYNISDATNDKTVITFSPDLSTITYYKEDTLPKISISKNKNTEMNITLNGNKIWEDKDSNITTLSNYSLYSSHILEGKNTIEVSYKTSTDTITKTYDFIFDSKSPTVNIESYSFESYTKLKEITGNTVEGNFENALLYYGNDIINEKPEIIIKDNNKYQLKWNNLSAYEILPSSTKPIRIEVVDLAGNRAFSDNLIGFNSIERPSTVVINKNDISLQNYNGNPILGNEVNYSSRLFPQHSKFLPNKFLQRVDIKDSVANIKDKRGRGDYLIRNFLFEYAFMGKDQSDDRYFYFTDDAGKPKILNTLDEPNNYYLLAGEDLKMPGKVDFKIKSTFRHLWDSYFEFRYDIYSSDVLYLNRTELPFWTYYTDSPELLYQKDDYELWFVENDNLKNIESKNIAAIQWGNWEFTKNSVGINRSSNTELFIPTLIKDLYDPAFSEVFKKPEDIYNYNYKLENEIGKIDINQQYNIHLDSTNQDLTPYMDNSLKNDLTGSLNPVKTSIVDNSQDIYTYQGGGPIQTKWVCSAYINGGGAETFTLRYVYKDGTNEDVIYSLNNSNYVLKELSRNDIKEIYIVSFSSPSYYSNWWRNYTFYIDNLPVFKFSTEMLTDGSPRIYFNNFKIWPSSDIVLSLIPKSGGDNTGNYQFDFEYTDGTHYIATIPAYTTFLPFFPPSDIYVPDPKIPIRNWTIPRGAKGIKKITKILSGVTGTQTHNVYINGTGIWTVSATSTNTLTTPSTSFFDFDTNVYINWSGNYPNDSCKLRYFFSDDTTKDVTYTFDSPIAYLERNDIVKLESIFDDSIWSINVNLSFLNINYYSNYYWYKSSNYNSPGPLFKTNISPCKPILTTRTKRVLKRTKDKAYFLQYHTTEESYNGNKYYHFDENSQSTPYGTNLNYLLKYHLVPQHYQYFYVADNSNDIEQRAKFVLAPNGTVKSLNEMIAKADSFTFDNSNYGKYVVFKFKKDFKIIDETSITNKIRFTYIYSTQDTGGNITEKVEALEINASEAYYVNGDGFVYYIVNTSEIKNKFREKYDITGIELNNNEVGKRIYDRGSLRLQYVDNITPEGIYLIGDSTTEFKDLITYDTGYENGTTAPEQMNANSSIKVVNTPVASSVTDVKTIAFWFRVEDEAINNPIYKNNYKRIFTISNDTNELYSLAYKAASIDFVDVSTQFVSLLPSVLGPVLSGKDQWNLFVIEINKTKSTITIKLNNGSGTEISLPSSKIAEILSATGKFYFGSKEDYNTGFYSVAKPFFIDKALNIDDINILYNLKDKDVTGDLTFNGMNTEIGTSDYQLKKFANGGDHLLFAENADFSQTNNNGFKLSSAHFNLLEKVTIGTKNIVRLRGATNYIGYNIKDSSLDDFTIRPATSYNYGYYYFGNKEGNYGLKYDKYYSIYGFVDSIDSTTDASIVLRINGKEQSFKIKSAGFFHFVYDNKENLIPQNVKLFIKTNGRVKFRDLDKFVLNEGNYLLPKKSGVYETDKSSLKIKYEFGLSGLVSFWYKPMNSNKEGYVNYDATLFDSEYVKIGTMIKTGEEDAVYYAAIKNENGINLIKLDTNVKVTSGWQHIQLSYDVTGKVVYFYVNGKVVGKSEGISLPKFGSLLGYISTKENVFIGSDKAGTSFAEGYIDELKFSRNYKESIYNDELTGKVRVPTSVIKNSNNTIIISNLKNYNILDGFYIIESLDGNCYFTSDIPTGTGDRNFNIPATFGAGRYRFTAYYTINGFNHKDILSFNIDDRPRFNLKENTPIIFNDVPTSVWFKFSFDKSYQFSNTQTQFSCIAAKLTSATFSPKYVYLTQDFINQDFNNWIMGVDNDGTGNISWKPVSYDNSGLLTLKFDGIVSNSDLTCDYKYFYFDNSFTDSCKYENLVGGETNTTSIPLASLNITSNDYKIVVTVGSNNGSDFYTKMNLEYTVKKKIGDTYSIKNTGNRTFNSNGKIELYFDDIFVDYGEYICDFKLLYNGIEYDKKTIANSIKWDRIVDTTNSFIQEKKLNINEFSLMYLDKINKKAGFYLQYDSKDDGDVTGLIEITIGNNKTIVNISDNLSLNNLLDKVDKSAIIEDVKIENDGYINVTIILKSDSLIKTTTLSLSNKADAPEIRFTNSVDYYISFNNVFFSWLGYYKGNINTEIEYRYNIDGKGFTNFDVNIKSVYFYNLTEGRHSFEIEAKYGDNRSTKNIPFYVDTKKPVFDYNKIKVEKNYYDNNGEIFDKVNITGEIGAVKDVSLKDIFVNNVRVSSNEDGSFIAKDIPITLDGKNRILITAVDRVRNYTDYNVEVDNFITQIRYPDINTYVKYSPLTIVGKISDNITSGMDIYLFDPMCSDKGDGNFTGWKKAKINEDRTFFIEDVFVNPGSREKALVTNMKLACVFKSGHIFTKEVNVKAKDILMPIDMSLSTHAAEGENTDTYVDINCKANIPNISSWSIDFNGDGIYDDTYIVANPELSSASSHKWSYKYSSVGIVKPRVRVITKDTPEGCFFSTTDTLIIHKKVRGAASQIVSNPIALSVVPIIDGSKLLFVVRGTTNNYFVDLYNIPKNTDEFTKKQFNINLTALGIENPVKIKALGKDHLIIASNNEGFGSIYELVANNLGNYEVVPNKNISFNDQIRDIAADDFEINLSFVNSNEIKKISLNADKIIEDVNAQVVQINTSGIKDIERMSSIAKDGFGLLISDYLNQRVLRYGKNNSFVTMIGESDREDIRFVKPMIVRSFENRIFVYDESRKDIQVFDQNFTPITTLRYNTDPQYDNYVENGFLIDLADMEIVTKEEDGGLVYFGLVLSKTSNKLGMIRLPQWEELRAKIRNNKIVFIQNGEIYCSKPDGGDMIRLLSTESRPHLEGQLDYPALSSDGRKLVFTSKQKLYNGVYSENQTENNQLMYTNLYIYDIEKKMYEKVNLGNKNGYEIERPQFNSNGDKIVFSAKTGSGKWQIYEYDTKTLTLKNLFDPTEKQIPQENLRFPYYSPDDKYLVFTTDYDGDYDVKIVELLQPSKRIAVTSNNSIDSYPVWATIFPFEIKNTSLNIESKIAFVSDRTNSKGVFYSYIKGMKDSSITVVKPDGSSIEDNPDSAAIGVSANVFGAQSDYPCFTGDGKAIVYQYSDIQQKELLKKKVINDTSADMSLPYTAKRPAGMKNMITGFEAENKDGNDINLKWNRYSDQNIKYTVQYKINKADEKFDQYEENNQTGSIITNREMGTEYLVRVCIIENQEEVATSQWKVVKMKEVIAKPESITIASDNPYLIKLKAWKPKPEYQWYFTWRIDNVDVTVTTAINESYLCSTSGNKTIQLKTSNKDGSVSAVSDPVVVKIVSDIDPVIEYNLASDSSYIELDASKSKGDIDFAATTWQISGPGNNLPVQVTGKTVIVPLTGFLHKIDVKLALRRNPHGQPITDTIERNIKVSLKFTELMPVITTEIDENNNKIVKFSAENSQGNIDWQYTKWTIFEDGTPIYNSDMGATTFIYQFPENSKDKRYAVSLSIKSKSDGKTQSILKEVSISATPILPVIKYQVLTQKEGDKVVSAKILFDCTQSQGNGIDFSQAKWNVPVAGTYGEQQATQYGPTAIYNLAGIDTDSIVDVNLTLSRRGGSDPVTKTETISIGVGDKPQGKIVVSQNIEETNTGRTILLDVFKSTGPNIDWERTEWLIDGQYSKKGPMVRYDVPFTHENTLIPYVCILYRTGMAPETYKDTIELGRKVIIPVISNSSISSKEKNVIRLSVEDTKGANIDWERTTWYIYDGNAVVTKEYGATITHAFATISADSSAKKMGYSVMVEMFLKGSAYPFVWTKSIDIDLDELRPIITEFESNDNTFTFTGEASKGSNIDWNQAKWTFGDSSESQYGPTVIHKYQTNSTDKDYTVTLTLTRRANNGVTETKMVSKVVKIGKDLVKAKVTAKLYGDYLILSAEKSEGKGLLLDRSNWFFHEGEGDSYTYSKSIQGGTIKKSDYSSFSSNKKEAGANLYMQGQVGIKLTVPVPLTGIIDQGDATFFRLGGGLNLDSNLSSGYNKESLVTDYDYSKYKDDNESFSTSNTYTGVVCKKNISGLSNVVVTLFVYRMTAEGGMEGQSITVKVDLNTMKSSNANTDGLIYE